MVKIKGIKRNYLIITLIFSMFFLLVGCNQKSNTNVGSLKYASEEESNNETTVEDNSNNIKDDVSNNKEKEEDKKDVTKGNIRISYIDVGQADCILIQQEGHNMLIDAGNNGDYNTIKSYLDTNGIKDLEYVIGTHPHEDHIGSMANIVKSFNINNIYLPNITTTTKTFENLVVAMKNKGLTAKAPKVGETFNLGSAQCTILGPNSSEYKDLNNYSIVVKIQFGNNSFLFQGDAEDISENEIISKRFDITADVIKIGHHGSSSSTTEGYLAKVNPKYAVISVGVDNSYNHPSKTTMDRLKEKNIPVYRTDESGTIVCTSDGENITFDKGPGDYSYRESASTDTSKVASDSSKETTGGEVASPPSEEGKIVYYTPNGKSYHYSKSCRTLSRSKTILEGTLRDVINMGKDDPCDICVK